MKHYNDICEPYEYEKVNAQGGIEILKKLSDCIISDRSLLKLVKAFISGKTENNNPDEVVDEDEDQQTNNQQNDEIVAE
jgi:hypothetical protein